MFDVFAFMGAGGQDFGDTTGHPLPQGPRPGRGIEGLKCLVNVLFSSYRPLSGIVIVLSDPIVIRIAKTFRKT